MEREMQHQEAQPPDQQTQEPTLHRDGASAEASKVPVSVPARFAAAWRSSWLARVWRRAMQAPHYRRMFAVGVAIAGVAMIIFLGRLLFTPMPQQIAPDTRRFFVANQPTLVFDHFIGNVRVTAGPDNQVSIKE